MSEHVWTLEHLAVLVADGLPAEERARAERHLVGCASCRAALEEYRRLDQSMLTLFEAGRPEPGAEDRVLRNLRTARRPARPLWAWLGAAAAVLLLGSVGGVLHQLQFAFDAPGTGESLFADL